MNQNDGPTLGNPGICTNCLGVINVNTSTGAITPSPEYYALEHIGRFVAACALNVYTNSQGNGDILDVAFRNPDGTIALIVYNDTSASQTITINWNNTNANYTMTAGSFATFKWQGFHGNPAIAPNQYYAVRNVNSGLCVDATNFGTTNNTTVQQYSCGASQSNQSRQFVATDSGYYRVVSRGGAANEQVWDVTAVRQHNGMHTSFRVSSCKEQSGKLPNASRDCLTYGFAVNLMARGEFSTAIVV